MWLARSCIVAEELVYSSLGAHLSKVRGLKLDVLPADTLTMLRSIGNEKANQLWEQRYLPTRGCWRLAMSIAETIPLPLSDCYG